MSTGEAEIRQHQALIDSVDAMLRPVVPLFLNLGVTCAELTDMIRGVFVQAAAAELTKEGRPASSARLSLMTGVNRNVVEALLHGRVAAHSRRREAEKHRVAMATVLELWHDDSRFSTLYGIPLDLSMSEEGSSRKFVELAASAAPGLNPSVLADELVVAGCAAYTDSGDLKCLHRMFIPTGLDPSAIAQIGQTTSTLTSTMVHNLLKHESEPSYFGRNIFSDSAVSETGFRQFLSYLSSEGQSFLEKTDRWMNTEQQIDRDPSGKRIGLCLYVYELAEQEGHSEISNSAAAVN